MNAITTAIENIAVSENAVKNTPHRRKTLDNLNCNNIGQLIAILKQRYPKDTVDKIRDFKLAPLGSTEKSAQQLAYFNDVPCGGLIGHFEPQSSEKSDKIAAVKPEDQVLIIDAFVVLKAYQNWGIGSMMMNWCKDQCATIKTVVPESELEWFVKRDFSSIDGIPKEAWFGTGIEVIFKRS